MPALTWNSKTPPGPISACLETDSLIYPQGSGYSSSLPDSPPVNQLIYGDNLAAMSALLPDYEGRIDLIYADPPFFTNRRFPARIGRGEDSRKPSGWQLAAGYPDHWADLEAYLDMLYPRLYLMHRLLAPTGSLYLHLDWHADAYARLLLDEIFGAERLLNEIVWVYHGPSPIRSAFNRKHDMILVYTKGPIYTFNVDAVRQPYDPSTVKTFASSAKAGFGKVPDLERGKVPEDWWYFPVVARLHNERTGYPTQKPQALLERVIAASSNPGELVADFFCGSGTTPLAASRLGRRFIAGDLTRRAIHTTQARLIQNRGKPFSMLHLKSESQVEEWQPVFSKLPGDHFQFLLKGDLISLATDPTGDPSGELDFWEVDPAFDGRVFRSAAQALRPYGKDGLPMELKLPFSPGDLPVCVRWVTAAGEKGQRIVGSYE